MPTTILLKRSLTTSIPASLANGEPAYTANGDVFYIGSNGAIVAIGGKRVPGVLTANQALVTNSTNMIDQVMLGNSTVNAVANSLALTLSNSTVSFSYTKPTAAQKASGDYFPNSGGGWSQVSGGTTNPGGANTQIEFNDSGSFGGSAGLTFDKTSNNMTVANTITGAIFAAGANVFLDTVKLSIGNSTVNATVNSTFATLQNATGIANLTPTTLVIGSATVNSTAFVAGANVFLDTVKASFGNSTVNAIINSIGIALNGTAAVVNTTQVTMGANVVLDTVKANFGNSTVNATVNSLGFAINGAVAINSTSMNLGLLGAAQVNTAANLSFTGANVSIPNANLAVKDLNVSGNLVVSGTVTAVDATNLQVKDSIIKLADNQTATDTLDIGWYGQYFDGTNTRFRGMLYDVSNSNYLLFSNSLSEPTTTLDTANVSITVATLRAYLASGNLISNSTGVFVGANSTYAVQLVANTLTLSSPLGVASGGTGLATVTSLGVLVGNGTGPMGIAAAVDGGVLQANSTATFFSATLDGGTY